MQKWIASEGEEAVKEQISRLEDADLQYLLGDWSMWARPEQLPPPGEWFLWLLLAGRGFGKTRTGTEWIRHRVKHGAQRIAIMGRDAADVRDVLVEGQSGLLSVCKPHDQDAAGNATGVPKYEPSKRRLTWANGAIATLYSADDPDETRGPEHDTALVDELAKYPKASEVWSNLMFGLRLGSDPRITVATTPRPLKLLRDLAGRESTVLTTGSTYANMDNLPTKFREEVLAQYEGTRLAQQEIEGKLTFEVPGTLWPGEFKRADAHPELVEVVVAVDPSGAMNAASDADEIGIVAAGKDAEGNGYLLGDYSILGGPHEWAGKAVAVAHELMADSIVAEQNFGGAMVKTTIEGAEPDCPVRLVVASRGKAVRASPVALLYEQGKVTHVGDHKQYEQLEEQMKAFTTAGYQGDGSPDRADAAIWALSALLIQRRRRRGIQVVAV